MRVYLSRLLGEHKKKISDVTRDSGLYFDPERPESIASTIDMYLNSSEIRDIKAWSAFNKSMNYSWSKCADNTFSFLRDVALSLNVNTNIERT